MLGEESWRSKNESSCKWFLRVIHHLEFFREFTNYERKKLLYFNILAGSSATSCELKVNKLQVHHMES